MHSGFAGLRSAMSMNIRASLPGRGRTPEAQGDIGRICEIWEECLSRFGHHQFLFGGFSIADAFFAPVVMRFRPTACRWRRRCRPTATACRPIPPWRAGCARRWPKPRPPPIHDDDLPQVGRLA